MPLPSSGAISLNQMHVEVGGTSGTTCSINDSDIRGLIGKASGAASSFSNFYGASNGFSVTMTVGAHTQSDQYITSQSYGYNNGSRSHIFTGTNFGSMTSINTNVIISGSQLVHLGWIDTVSSVRLVLEDSQSISNSGWTTLSWGSNNYSRTSATFTTGTKSVGYTNYAQWSWGSISSAPYTSGNRSVSIT